MSLDIMALFEWDLGGQKEADLSKKNLKSKEEIDRLLVDERLGEVERAQTLLRKGQPVQRLAVLRSLHTLYDALDPPGSLTLISNLVTPIFVNDGVAQDEREAAAESFRNLLDVCTGTEARVNRLFPMALKLLQRVRDECLVSCTSEVVIAIVGQVPRQVLVEQVLPLGLSLCSVSETAERRSTGCRLLGAVAAAAKLSPEEFENAALTQGLGLCQDTEAVVRRAMCAALPDCVAAVRPKTVTARIVPELVELLNDEEAAVKVAGLVAAIKMRPLVASDIWKTSVMPVLVCMIEQSTRQSVTKGFGSGGGSSDETKSRSDGPMPMFTHATMTFIDSTNPEMDTGLDPVSQAFAEKFGELLAVLFQCGDLSADRPSDLAPFLEFYKTLANHSSPASRRLCAFNLPAVACVLGAGAYKSCVHDILRCLGTDEDEGVRKCVAAGFHEIAARLPYSHRIVYLKDTIIDLLQDSNPVVVGAVVDTMHLWLWWFGSSDEDETHMVLSSFLPYIMTAAKSRAVTEHWRRRVRLLAALRPLALLLGNRCPIEDIVDFIDDCINCGCSPVRSQAVASLMWFVRFCARSAARKALEHSVQLITLRGKSWWRRYLFIDACGAGVWLFSRSIFKAEWLPLLLTCAEDPIPSVRRHVLEALPFMRLWLVFPKDAEAISRLTATAKAACDDPVADVRTEAQRALACLNFFEDEMGGNSTANPMSVLIAHSPVACQAVANSVSDPDAWCCTSPWLYCPFNPPISEGVLMFDMELVTAAHRIVGTPLPPGVKSFVPCSAPLVTSLDAYRAGQLFAVAGAHSEREEKTRCTREGEQRKAATEEEEEDTRRQLEARRQEARERAAAQKTNEAAGPGQRMRYDPKRTTRPVEPRGAPPLRKPPTMDKLTPPSSASSVTPPATTPTGAKSRVGPRASVTLKSAGSASVKPGISPTTLGSAGSMSGPSGVPANGLPSTSAGTSTSASGTSTPVGSGGLAAMRPAALTIPSSSRGPVKPVVRTGPSAGPAPVSTTTISQILPSASAPNSASAPPPVGSSAAPRRALAAASQPSTSAALALSRRKHRNSSV